MSAAPGSPEPAGLERAYVEHQGRVFRAAYRVTGNAHDAEDVLQTVFLRLARHQGLLPDAANLAGYLHRSAVNAALDVLRSRQRAARVPLDEAEQAAPGTDSPERVREAAELQEWLRAALTRVSPQAAEIFALRYLEGLENREIARMLGGSRVTVAVTLHRTRRRLEREFRARGGGRT
jgi:RNA polymerase sigma-70 factor, ECF subfamily